MTSAFIIAECSISSRSYTNKDSRKSVLSGCQIRMPMALATAALSCLLNTGCLDMVDINEMDSYGDTNGHGEYTEYGDKFTDFAQSTSEMDASRVTASSYVIDTQSLHSFSSFVWYQDQPAVPMGNFDDAFCFLTEVRGKFRGDGEEVHVYVNASTWWLGGTSHREGVMARATCIPREYWGQTLDVSPEFFWNQGNSDTFMGNATNRVCFLTYVSGKFEGGGEMVQAERSGGSWWLGGTSLQKDVSAGARCVNTNYLRGPYYWQQGQSPKSMEDANAWVCGLNRMSGRFMGGGEAVHAYVNSSRWYLGGSSLQHGVSTTSYCI